MKLKNVVGDTDEVRTRFMAMNKTQAERMWL